MVKLRNKERERERDRERKHPYFIYFNFVSIVCFRISFHFETKTKATFRLFTP